MERVVDRHFLTDAVPVRVFWVDLPARVQLAQRERVRPVAVDLVRGGEDKRRLLGVQPNRLEEVERPDRVDVEVDKGLPRRPVVRGLGRSMDNELDRIPVAAEDREDRLAIADVEIVVDVALAERFLYTPSIPVRRGVGAEKDTAHVVIDPDDVEAERPEVDSRLRADQPARAGDYCNTHALILSFIPPPAGGI